MGADRTAWIEWTRTELTSSEMDAELGRLPPPERARLEDAQWLWMPGHLLWCEPSGALRRARFTHGTYFQTTKGEFYIDSAGRPRRLPQDPTRA
jgi:hypothetical protein